MIMRILCLLTLGKVIAEIRYDIVMGYYIKTQIEGS